MSGKRMKLKDLAEYTGVSVSTISRVLNKKDRVSDDVRKKVNDAVEKFNYVPDYAARSLRIKKSNAIGVIVSDVSNPFFARIIKGIEEVAYKKGYYTIVCNSDANKEKEINYGHMLLNLNICGLIISTRNNNRTVENLYISRNVPIVYIDNIPPWETDCCMVTVNNYNISKRLVNKLIEAGHKDIAIISEESMVSTSADRIRGWKDALSEAGIEWNRNYLLSTDFKNSDIDNCMMKIEKFDSKPTAFFLTNNVIKNYFFGYIKQHNIKVPEDISVVSFDAEDEYNLLDVRLTGVIQPDIAIGSAAASIVLRINENKDSQQSESIVMKVIEVEGNSVKKL